MKPMSVTVCFHFLTALCLLWICSDDGWAQDSATEGCLVVRVFSIPPDFTGAFPVTGDQDPFASPAVHVRPSSPGILGNAKIPDLPSGAGVVIDRRANQLAIRHTEAFIKQLEPLIATWNEDWKKHPRTVVYFDEVTFAVSPRKRIGNLQEAAYQMPSNFTTPDMMDELRQQGVMLPAGSAAHFDRKTMQATIRNTQANIDLAVTWMASVWETSGEVPPFQNKAPFPMKVERGQVDQKLRDLAAKKLPSNGQ